MTAPSLRVMTRRDLAAVLELDAAVFGEDAWSADMLAGELAQQPASRYYVVAEEAGTLVGYAGLLAAGEQSDVLTIGVAAGSWGRGIGSQLLAVLLDEARRRGCTETFLEVRADNMRAQRLYKWWGFTEVGIRRGYYQPSGTDAIVMRRDLPGPAGDGKASNAWPGADTAGNPAGGGL
jgi:[ribosomal protein S18]-alanine N-acetyltransferase